MRFDDVIGPEECVINQDKMEKQLQSGYDTYFWVSLVICDI